MTASVQLQPPCSAPVEASVALTVRADGTTKNIVVKTPIGDAAIEACLKSLVGRLKFPRAAGETKVSYPFSYR